MFNPEGKGTINLVAWCLIAGSWRECFILEACAQSQTAEVQIKGTYYPVTVPFSGIASVSLKHDDGTIIQCFGAPRVSNPESLAFATNWREITQTEPIR